MRSSSSKRTGAGLMPLFLLVFLSICLVALGFYFVAHGRFNIDEGLHLNAGRLLFEEGKWLYRDFPFSQGPGGPFLYGAWGSVFGYSIAAGRTLSLLINLASVVWMVCSA